jgi:hypothetical protein
VIVLPCCLFTLLALLDRFERSLPTDETVRAAEAKQSLALAAAVAFAPLAEDFLEAVGADVVALPLSVTVSPITPSAATG